MYVVPRWKKVSDAACWLIGKAMWAALVATATAVITCAVIFSHYERRAADVDMSTYTVFSERNEIYDAAGCYLRPLPGPTTRKCVTAEELPPHLNDALLVMEDNQFYKHHGVNWRGVARAAWHDLTTLSLSHGGSSPTQQTAKMWLARRDESAWDKIDRKLLEWQVALRIERQYSKAEILANYWNRIDFGAALHGIAAASEGFFGKKPKDLTVLEAATLASIVRSPNQYSPISHPEKTVARRNLVLRRMVEEKHLALTEAERLAKQPITLALDEWRKKQKPDDITILAMQELQRCVSAEAIARGGLKVELTLDSAWNTKAAREAERHLRSIEARRAPSKARLQVAIIAVENTTGAIKVMRGGRESSHSQFNRVFQSRRDPGSAIKPFTYTLAFQQGMSPDDIIDNGPIRPGELSFGPRGYSPDNAGGSDGRITLRRALEISGNRAAVRLGDKVGFDTFVSFLEQLGVAKSSTVPISPSSFLGSFGVRPVDLAAGYTIFPGRGIRCADPHIIQRITNRAGDIVYEFSGVAQQRCTPQSAASTAECLYGVMQHGTARASTSLGLRLRAMGKTGTTNDVKDAWFCGATDEHSCVVWVGFDRPGHILNAYAAELVLPLWVKVVNAGASKETRNKSSLPESIQREASGVLKP
jgi:membrane peptidoglycan carboxypeptidase